MAHDPLRSALTSLLGTTPVSVSTDRGVIYEFLVGRGVSEGTAQSVQVYAIGPLRVLLILVVAFVLTRMVSRLSHRLMHSLRLVSPLVRATDRGEERLKTLTGVFTSILRAIIWVIALLTVLAEFRIDLAPFVATATVIGAAVGFGAQSLVKDFLSGVLILAEDQYGVGDSITIVSSGTSGVVESVNLRTTRVRGSDGMIWYIPNGDIRAVGNTTETDSAALVDVKVPHTTDLVAAGRAAEETARELAARPEWRQIITAPPTWVGVEAADGDGATLRVVAHTTPGGHVAAARELLLVILERLRRDGLAWASVSTGAPAPATTGAPALATTVDPVDVAPPPPAAVQGTTTAATAVAPPPPRPRLGGRRIRRWWDGDAPPSGG
jgi:small-conductance mechanosensitive channel